MELKGWKHWDDYEPEVEDEEELKSSREVGEGGVHRVAHLQHQLVHLDHLVLGQLDEVCGLDNTDDLEGFHGKEGKRERQGP